MWLVRLCVCVLSISAWLTLTGMLLYDFSFIQSCIHFVRVKPVLILVGRVFAILLVLDQKTILLIHVLYIYYNDLFQLQHVGINFSC